MQTQKVIKTDAARMTALGLTGLAGLLAAISTQAGQYGNPLIPANPWDYAADADRPFVIVGEYNRFEPSPSSATVLPGGTIQDVRFYGSGAYAFTIYALHWVKQGSYPHEQVFEVDASQYFSGTNTTQGVQTVPANLKVNCGDLLAFAGVGPWYEQQANDAPGTDATYESSSEHGTYKAIPPGGNGTFITNGLYGDLKANYDYINDQQYGNQGRLYCIAVDVPESTGGISIQCPGDITNYVCNTNNQVPVSFPQPTVTTSGSCPFSEVVFSTIVAGSPVTIYSGSLFAVNTTTTVYAQAFDTCCDASPQCSFTVTVVGKNCNTNSNGCIQFANASNIVTNSCDNCVSVQYPITAIDLCCNNQNAKLTFAPTNGTCFLAGTTTTVTCTATSPCGHSSTTNFTVSVVCTNFGVITIVAYPNNQGTPAIGSPIVTSATGVTFVTTGGTIIPTSYTSTPTSTFTFLSRPSFPVTAFLNTAWQAAGYIFVPSTGGNLGAQAPVTAVPATLYMQAPNVLK